MYMHLHTYVCVCLGRPVFTRETNIKIYIQEIGFENVVWIKLKLATFWDVESCSLIGTDRRFGGVNCLHHQLSGQCPVCNMRASSSLPMFCTTRVRFL
jgi:hypothetical protein